MDVEMDASPKYFDPEDLTIREQFRRYGYASNFMCLCVYYFFLHFFFPNKRWYFFFFFLKENLNFLGSTAFLVWNACLLLRIELICIFVKSLWVKLKTLVVRVWRFWIWSMTNFDLILLWVFVPFWILANMFFRGGFGVLTRWLKFISSDYVL